MYGFSHSLSHTHSHVFFFFVGVLDFFIWLHRTNPTLCAIAEGEVRRALLRNDSALSAIVCTRSLVSEVLERENYREKYQCSNYFIAFVT